MAESFNFCIELTLPSFRKSSRASAPNTQSTSCYECRLPFDCGCTIFLREIYARSALKRNWPLHGHYDDEYKYLRGQVQQWVNSRSTKWKVLRQSSDGNGFFSLLNKS